MWTQVNLLNEVLPSYPEANLRKTQTSFQKTGQNNKN